MNKKIREINEAYDVLSNDFLREQYDAEYERYIAQKKNAQNNIQNNNFENNNYNNYQYNNYEPNENQQEQRTHKYKYKYNKNNNNVGTINGIIDIFKEVYNNRPSKEQFKEMTSDNLLALVLTVIVIIIIGIILWFIPFTNGWMRELLFENPVFNWIGGLFSR